MKNKNLGHLLVKKSRDYTTTTMTMATKTWPAKDTGNSFWHRNMLYFAFHKSNLSRVSECKWWLNFLSTKTLSARVLIQSNMCRVFGILISGEIFCTRFVQEWITFREFFFFYYYLHWSELVWQWHRWYDPPRVMSSPGMECEYNWDFTNWVQPARQAETIRWTTM